MPVAFNGPVDLYYESFGQPGNDTLLLINGLGSQCIAYDVALCEKFVENGFFVIRFHPDLHWFLDYHGPGAGFQGVDDRAEVFQFLQDLSRCPGP